MAPLPNTIRFEGRVYHKVAASDFDVNVQAISEGISNAVTAFDQFMALHQEGETGPAISVLTQVFDGTYGAALACKRIFETVVPQKMQASPQKVRYEGRVYTAVNHPYESLQASDAARECEVADAHLNSIMKDATTVAYRARDLLKALKELKSQAGDALTRHPDKLEVGEVAALDPDTRIEQFKEPLRSLNKANRSLNYTVDAASTAIKVVLDQVDAMVDEWEARIDSMNAPHPSKELTQPMLMSDSPAAVFDELGGL